MAVGVVGVSVIDVVPSLGSRVTVSPPVRAHKVVCHVIVGGILPVSV